MSDSYGDDSPFLTDENETPPPSKPAVETSYAGGTSGGYDELIAEVDAFTNSYGGGFKGGRYGRGYLKSTGNFIRRHWVLIIVALIVLFVGVFYYYGAITWRPNKIGSIPLIGDVSRFRL